MADYEGGVSSCDMISLYILPIKADTTWGSPPTRYGGVCLVSYSDDCPGRDRCLAQSGMPSSSVGPPCVCLVYCCDGYTPSASTCWLREQLLALTQCGCPEVESAVVFTGSPLCGGEVNVAPWGGAPSPKLIVGRVASLHLLKRREPITTLDLPGSIA